MADNDYTRTAEDCRVAADVAETALCNAQDPDIADRIEAAMEKLREAEAMAEERA